MNRLEKMEHLQVNLNTWFSEWASYANEKERIGARMLGRNKSLELSIQQLNDIIDRIHKNLNNIKNGIEYHKTLWN